ncbi:MULTISPECIES: hypothetical protein [Chryseobacterium]|uniref:DUF4468 domain-containing protein n=1 Tax=Chryseobacterium candidae TaxID=1978493 RepID=A0ABY2RA15_9FLAO|nr:MULTISPECIES: hypothetical protein [Chryseobacterium]PXW17688.1 hypothetical protein C8D70_10110 [Chryseobacterium sp. CBTAP 102]THV62422.1 hypothetical protein EK417_05830 [Chryseobacterium candidae]
MKTKSLLFLFVLLSSMTFSQTKANPDDAAIKKSLTYFINGIQSKQIDQAVSCIYPKYFTIVSKEQMTQILNMTYNNPFMKIEVQDLKFGNIEKPELITGEYFSITHYFLKLKCNVSSLNDEIKKKMNSALTAKYGANNVKYLANEGSYLINANMKACAVSKDKKAWKFVILEKQYKKELLNVLPKKILDKF